MTFFDEFAAAFRDQSIREITQAIHASPDTVPRFKHGDLPPGSMEFVRRGKPRQPGADYSYGSVV